LFKTGKYTEALKKAKEAIEMAKENDDSTTELINEIIEKL
jgi:DNA-binding ferritin-like protein